MVLIYRMARVVSTRVVVFFQGFRLQATVSHWQELTGVLLTASHAFTVTIEETDTGNETFAVRVDSDCCTSRWPLSSHRDQERFLCQDHHLEISCGRPPKLIFDETELKLLRITREIVRLYIVTFHGYLSSLVRFSCSLLFSKSEPDLTVEFSSCVIDVTSKCGLSLAARDTVEPAV